MRSIRSSDVQNNPENRAFEVGLKRVAVTSHSDVHVHVNAYLNLPSEIISIRQELRNWVYLIKTANENTFNERTQKDKSRCKELYMIDQWADNSLITWESVQVGDKAKCAAVNFWCWVTGPLVSGTERDFTSLERPTDWQLYCKKTLLATLQLWPIAVINL